MTHPSEDPIDRLIAMRDRLDALIAGEAEREQKLAAENAQRLLSKLARQATVTDGDRAQIKGVKEQLRRVA
jgi:hypothetical protein